MLPADIASLTHLVAEHNIKSLKGLEYAINLEFLHIGRTEVSDLTPLAGLEKLSDLKVVCESYFRYFTTFWTDKYGILAIAK